MYDSKEIAAKSLQRATEIKETRARNRRLLMTIGASTALCAVVLVTAFTVFSHLTDENDITISDPVVPLSPSPKMNTILCEECETELIDDECEECNQE